MSMGTRAQDQFRRIPQWPLVLLGVVLLLSSIVRFAALEDRPMHADEAVQTYIFAELLENGDYRYDPEHYHGPLPHYINLPISRILGVEKLDTLQAWQFRLQPAIAGVALVILTVLCVGSRRDASRLDVPWTMGQARWHAALLAGISPLLVYFSRMAIHETLLACFALAIPFFAMRWIEKRALGWLIALGVSLGCLHAVKETWCIIVFSWVIAVAACWPRASWQILKETGVLRIAMVILLALATSFLLYSQAGKHPQAFVDAWRTLFAYRTGGGHEKDLLYYFREVLGFYPAAGWLWGEGVIMLFAVVGIVFTLLAKKKQRLLATIPALPRMLALSAFVQIAVYTILKYKTPWLMLVPVASLVPMAAHGWTLLEEKMPRPAISLACSLLLLVMLTQSLRGSFRQATNPEIPFVYTPTLPAADAELTRRANRLRDDALVALIGDNYWPVPWYFRAHRDNIGYFSDSDAPPRFGHFSLVLDSGYALDSSRTGEVFELRPGYFVRIVNRVSH